MAKTLRILHRMYRLDDNVTGIGSYSRESNITLLTFHVRINPKLEVPKSTCKQDESLKPRTIDALQSSLSSTHQWHQARTLLLQLRKLPLHRSVRWDKWIYLVRRWQLKADVLRKKLLQRKFRWNFQWLQSVYELRTGFMNRNEQLFRGCLQLFFVLGPRYISWKKVDPRVESRK